MHAGTAAGIILGTAYEVMDGPLNYDVTLTAAGS